MIIPRTMLTGLVAALAVMALTLGGCAAVEKEMAQPAPEKLLACAVQGKVVQAIAPEAKLVGLECSYKKFDGVKSLAVKVTLQNVSQEDQRFRVNIFLDNGKGMGGLIPARPTRGW